MGAVTYENLVSWLVPPLLAIMVALLGWIGRTLSEMAKTLAVAVYRVDDHERRIGTLEADRRARDRAS